MVWLFGVVLAPLVHLGLHATLAPHSHAPRPSAEAQCHEGHCHAGRHDDEGVTRTPSERERPAEHGRSSPLHGHVAALFPAPALVLPPFVAIGERAVVPSTDDVIDALPAPLGHARGPPV